MSGKSVSSGTKNPAKYFKWSLEKRLLLIDTVTKVDEEQKLNHRTAGKVVDGSAAPAVAPVRLTTKEKWQEVASRLPPDIFQDIDRTKLESSCRSQFVKLHQRFQFMSRDSHDRFRRHGKPDAIMTDEICQKIAKYRATYVHGGRRKDLAVLPRKQGHPPLHKGHKGCLEQVSVNNDKQQRTGRRRMLARGRPLHNGRGEDVPGPSNDKQQRTLHPRKLVRGRHPLRKGNCTELHVLARKLARGRRPIKKGNVEHVSLSNDEPPRVTTRPEKRAEPSQVVSQSCGHPPLQKDDRNEAESVSNDKQLCTEEREERDGEHAPVSDGLSPMQEKRGEQAPASDPLQEERGEPEGRELHAPLSVDKQRCTEDCGEPGGEDTPVTNDKQLCMEDRGEPGQEHAAPIMSDDNQLCTLSPKLDGSHVVAVAGAQEEPQSQQLSKREALETKLSKVGFPRSGMFRWSEAARLQVIHGVRMMNNLTEAGQIRSWREVAERLPMRLFWDIDLDRLATIAKKQFSEMRRRYRILKDNELAGVSVKFKTLSKKILHELEEYDEDCLRRTPETPSLCASSQDRFWVTKRPHEAHESGEFSNAEGAVLVETFPCFSSSENDMENASSRSIYRGFDTADDACRHHQRRIPRAHERMEPSEFDGRDSSFQRYSYSEDSRNSESSYREFTQNEDAHVKFMSDKRRETSKFSFSNREGDSDVRRRQTMSSFSDDRRSEPQQEGPLRRRRHCSSYGRSYNSLEDNTNNNRSNQLNRRVLPCRKQKRVRSYVYSDYRSQNHSISVREELCSRARNEEHSPDPRYPETDDANDYNGRNQEGNQRGYGQSSAYGNSRSEQSLQDRRPHNLEEQDYNHSADGSGSHSDHDNSQNSGEGSHDDQQSESRSDRHVDHRGEYDSAYSNVNESKSRSYSDAEEAQDKRNKSNDQNSESEDFLQSDSRGDSQRDTEHEKRQESIKWKGSSSAADSQDDKRASPSHQTSQSNPRHWDDEHRAHPQRKRARVNEEFKHDREATPSRRTKGTDCSEPEHDEMSNDPPVLHETLKELDLEYSRLDSWMKHQLFPMEIEKITNAIQSEIIPGALSKKRQMLGFDEVVNKCRRKRMRLVIKAEFQQVRLKLVQEIERSSKVVVREILESLRT